MITQDSYRIPCSITKEQCINKEIANALIGGGNKSIRTKYGFTRGFSFENMTPTLPEIYNLLITGHNIAQKYNPRHINKDGSFPSSEKTNKNLDTAQFIGIDIDGSPIPLYDYLNKIGGISTGPTLGYSTYGNDKGNGYKFRLIYVLDTGITNFLRFRYIAYLLIDWLNSVVPGVNIDESCARATQQFNGTWFDLGSCLNPEAVSPQYFYTGNILQLTDFIALGYSDLDYINFLRSGARYCTDTQREYQEIIDTAIIEEMNGNQIYNLPDLPEDEEDDITWRLEHYGEHLLRDYYQLAFNDNNSLTKFYKYWSIQYPFFYRTCCDDGANHVGWFNKFGNVDRIPTPPDYWRYGFGSGDKKYGPSEDRIRRLKYFLKCSRLMKPEIDYKWMLLQAIGFFLFHIDNSDYKFNKRMLMKKVNDVMRSEFEEFEDRNKYIKEKGLELCKESNPQFVYRDKKAKDDFYKSGIAAIQSQATSINDLKDKLVNDMGVSVSQSYRILGSLGIDIKETDKKLALIDLTKSEYWNYCNLKNNGIKVSRKSMKGLIQKKKNERKI